MAMEAAAVTEAGLIEDYPRLTDDDVSAAIASGAEAAREPSPFFHDTDPAKKPKAPTGSACQASAPLPIAPPGLIWCPGRLVMDGLLANPVRSERKQP